MNKTGLVAQFFATDEQAVGLSNGEIGRRLNVSRSLVSKVRLRLGLSAARRQARIRGELRWMHTAAIGQTGPEAELERVKRGVADAWMRYDEHCIREEHVSLAFRELWGLLNVS